MKYNYLNEQIPMEMRKDLNEKILYLIDNGLCEINGISKEDIYNSYTGDGGLHNLNFNDYNSFHDYTKAKQEVENGQFFTGHNEAKFLIDCLNIGEFETVMDLTCGSGSLFNFLPNESNIYGNEIDIKAYKVCKYLYPLANIIRGDMREYNPYVKVDYIVGNPPFNLRLTYNNQEIYSQMIYIKRAVDLLKTGGILALIVPHSFLDDEFSSKADREFMNDNFSFIGQIKLDNKAFKHLGVENFATKIILFYKNSEYLDRKEFNNVFIEGNAGFIYNNYIAPIKQSIKENKNKIYLENINKDKLDDSDKEFKFKVDKLLFDIKRTKSIKDKYSDCWNYLQKFYNQKQPESVNYEEWQKMKITKDQIIKYMKDVLKYQHGKKTMKQLIKKETINNLIVEGGITNHRQYDKMIGAKRKQFLNQSQKFSEMKLNDNIKYWLNSKKLYSNTNEKYVYLNDKQKEDLNKILQKQYGYLQWGCGAGKSFSSVFYGLYRLEYTNIKNIIIVAPAIAIKNTYIDMLEDFNITFRVINTVQDIREIKQGEFLLLTFGMIIKLERHIKKFIKVNSKKFCLILDEADNISNPKSKRTLSILKCFRKLPYKLLLSGTSTRNSINEIFEQLELLYNNSVNMLSMNDMIYVTNKESKETKREINEYYNKPYPAYKKGYELFTESFVPKKISVFGVDKFNQNIYNKDILKDMIDKTIITKTLKDITGKKLFNINTVLCKFNDYELNLYKQILQEFYTMSAEYHIQTGNSRKDAMFRILAQLNTLLKSCSISHTFAEYKGNEVSNKFLKVFELLNTLDNENVVIGCTRVKTVKAYELEIKKRFPNRKVFTIIGNEQSLNDRKRIIKEIKNYSNAILICTQQSLSCSMSIDFIDHVVIPEQNWNDSSMEQFRARFTRYTSDNMTNIYNVLYRNSIEVNLMKLILAKEKLNLFMKNEDIEENELFEKYGVSKDIFNCLMVKEKDSEGRINITWGDQEII